MQAHRDGRCCRLRHPWAGVAGGGEAAGPLWPPEVLTEDALGAGRAAAAAAYAEAGARAADIDFFGLYARPMPRTMRPWPLRVAMKYRRPSTAAVRPLA